MTDKPMIPDLPVICMFWLGPSISYIEQLSMLSFLRAGHRVQLYVYGDVGNVPEGVEICDANTVAPQGYLVTLRYPNGSYALAANYLRLLLQQQGRGVWADADMICLAPITRQEPCLFGYEHADTINNAVLYLPPDSPIITEMLHPFGHNAMPWWLSLNRKRQLLMRRMIGRSFGPQDHHWGTFGPAGLTAVARKYGLDRFAQPVEVFYPLPIAHAGDVYAPGGSVEGFITPRSLTIHLWHQILGDRVKTRPPSTSALGRMLSDYGI